MRISFVKKDVHRILIKIVSYLLSNYYQLHTQWLTCSKLHNIYIYLNKHTCIYNAGGGSVWKFAFSWRFREGQTFYLEHRVLLKLPCNGLNQMVRQLAPSYFYSFAGFLMVIKLTVFFLREKIIYMASAILHDTDVDFRTSEILSIFKCWLALVRKVSRRENITLKVKGSRTISKF